MNNITYKEILKNSPLAYMWVKCITNEQGIYIDFEITEANESFNSYISVKIIQGKKISDLLTQQQISQINIDDMFKTCKEKGNCSYNRYNKFIKKHVNSEIYYIEDEVFLIRLTEIDSENIVFSDILRNSPFSVWIKDKEGKYIDVNIQAQKKFRKEYDDIIGKNDFDFWDEKIAKEYIRQDKEVMQSRKMYSYQNVLSLEIENDKKVYEVTKWPYKDVNGSILGTIGISIEIVDNSKLRENIEENEKNFETIVNFSDEVFIIYDRNKAIYISPSFKKIFGEEPYMLYKDYRYWKQYYDSEDMENFNVRFEEPIEFISRGNPNKNINKWFWVKALPIKDERGNAIKKIVIIRDITERKNLDLELESLRMDFFANISHELRTPINVIYGTLQLLKKIADINKYNEPGKIDRYLNIIDQNCLRLLKLVNNLIDSTKIDAGYLEYNPQNFNIISFVEDICNSVSEFIKLSNLNLIFDTNEEESIISFDLDMMERIILNLLSNAIKFNEENGCIYINVNCNKDFVEIIIRDTGIGICKENLNNIFGRFEQVSNKKVHYKEGSGIGLALVKSLVELHGGYIKANSEVGEGSVFTVGIPNTISDKAELSLEKSIDTAGKVSRMSVEFSDIYV